MLAHNLEREGAIGDDCHGPGTLDERRSLGVGGLTERHEGDAGIRAGDEQEKDRAVADA